MKCYQCRSDVHQNCDDDLPENYLEDCMQTNNITVQRSQTNITEGDAIYCRYSVQKCNTWKYSKSIPHENVAVYFLGSKQAITIRECAFVHNQQSCYEILSPDASIHSCDCGTEGCNAAWKSEGAKNFVFLIVTLLLLRFFPP